MMDELQGDVVLAAKRLLGCALVRRLGDNLITGRIVETEAYHQFDAASHSYKGKTSRAEIMFGPAGYVYVYFTYGMHYCMNIVTGPEGEGSAVLIRALEPLEGIELMRTHRGGVVDTQLTNGPAKLCQALQVTMAFNGHNAAEPPLQLMFCEPIAEVDIVTTTRIGITRNTKRPWRFYINDNPFVSKR